MCLILSALAAAFFFVLGRVKKDGSSARKASLAFAAASLMWCVDGVSSALAGEGFFDLSAGDFVLGLIVLAAGSVFYVLLEVFAKADDGFASKPHRHGAEHSKDL